MNFFYKYKKWLILSASIHVFILVFVLFFNRASFLKPLLLTGGGGGPSINVEVVGLPNVLKKDIDTLNKAMMEKVQEEIVEKDKMVLKNDKKTIANKKDLIQKLKQSIEDRDNYLKKIKVIKGIKESQANNKTGSPSLEVGTGNGSDVGSSINPYFVSIKELVRNYWQIPTWLKAEGLNTQITIYIGMDGQLTNIEITKPSGNSDFDKLAFQAVKNSAPFTPPPPSVKDLVENGVVLSFP